METVKYSELIEGDEFEDAKFGICRVLPDKMAKNVEEIVYFPATHKVTKLPVQNPKRIA